MRRPSLVTFLLFLWILFVVYGTSIPFDFHFDAATAAQGWHDAQLNPLRNPEGGHLSRTDVFSNVLLFLPLGFFAFASWRKKTIGPFAAWVLATLLGLVLSGGVEILQLWSPLRTTSANDLLTNTVGALLGATGGWLWFFLGTPRLQPWLTRQAKEHPQRLVAIAVVAAWLLAGALPLDLSLDVDDLKRAVKASRWIPFGPDFLGQAVAARPAAWLADLLRFSVLGGLLAWAFAHEGPAEDQLGEPSGMLGGPSMARVIAASLLSAFVALVVELGQIGVVSHGTDLTVVVLAAGGSLLGAVIFQRSSTLSRALGWGLAAWTGVLILDRWSPFVWSAPETLELQWRHWLPFLPYFQRLGPAAVADLLREVGMGVPLGVFWALRALASAGAPAMKSVSEPKAWRATAMGFLVGLILEGGQLFVAGRTADITDAISLAAGVGLGVILAAWGRQSLSADPTRIP